MSGKYQIGEGAQIGAVGDYAKAENITFHRHGGLARRDAVMRLYGEANGAGDEATVAALVAFVKVLEARLQVVEQVGPEAIERAVREAEGDAAAKALLEGYDSPLRKFMRGELPAKIAEGLLGVALKVLSRWIG